MVRSQVASASVARRGCGESLFLRFFALVDLWTALTAALAQASRGRERGAARGARACAGAHAPARAPARALGSAQPLQRPH